MPCCPGLIWDRAGTNWGCISLLYNTTLGRGCTVYSTQCVECTAVVDMYVRTYVRTCTYVPDSTGREGCFRFTKRLINFSLAVTSHVNACTFIHLVYSHVCFSISSDVLVPTCSFWRARSDVLVLTCSFWRARAVVIMVYYSRALVTVNRKS